MKDSKTCKICLKTFTRRNYMLKHMENIHAKRYSCSVCSRYFPGPTEHSCAVDDGRFVCYVENCSLKFASGMTLRLHIRDGHKKLDENNVPSNFKTKKGARDFIKTLCQSINMLSVCFDELKYQVDTMAEFMKTLGYESQSNSCSSANSKEKQRTTTEEECDYEELTNYIDYIDEELIEEVHEDSDEQMVIENDEVVHFIEQPKQEMIVNNCKEFIRNSEPTEKRNQNTTITIPKKENQIVITTVDTAQGNETGVTKLDETTIMMSNSLPLFTNTQLKNFPPVAKVGSTIIRQLPFKTESISDKNAQPLKPSSTSSIEQTAPPLFLKIQYDNSETEVCKDDPKITFHFDTRPPDDEKEEFIN